MIKYASHACQPATLLPSMWTRVTFIHETNINFIFPSRFLHFSPTNSHSCLSWPPYNRMTAVDWNTQNCIFFCRFPENPIEICGTFGLKHTYCNKVLERKSDPHLCFCIWQYLFFFFISYPFILTKWKLFLFQHQWCCSWSEGEFSAFVLLHSETTSTLLLLVLLRMNKTNGEIREIDIGK